MGDGSVPAAVAAFLAPRVGATEPLCVGLSGGRDSVALLAALVDLGREGAVSALHIHHGLSPAADDWACFCVDLGVRLGVAVQVRRVVVAPRGEGVEAAARAARYHAFAQEGACNLLLGHHRDDQAETVLFNLLRGCGVAGAAGIPAERRFPGQRILRPLLGVGRNAISGYLQGRDLPWIEDESNADTALSRNFLRRTILPPLEARFPGAGERLAAAAGRFAAADALLGELAGLDWERLSLGETLPLASARSLSAPRLANLLRGRLRHLGWQPPTASRLDEFVRQILAAGPGKRPELHLPAGRMAVRRGALCWIATEAL